MGEVHPNKSSGNFKGEDKPDDGGTKGNESRFVRCKKCNSINDTEKRQRGDGWAGNIKYEAITGTNLKQPVVGGAGCWYCGSSEGW